MITYLIPYQRFLSIAMLAIFAVVILPKELWHEHPHGKHPGHQIDHQELILESSEDCPICDFQLLPYTADLPLPEVGVVLISPEVRLPQNTDPVKAVVLGYSGRAPPALLG